MAVEKNVVIPTTEEIIKKLEKYDPKLRQHLFLLLLVAQQDINLFNTFVEQLEKQFD